VRASSRQGESKIGVRLRVTLGGRVSISANGVLVEEERFPGRQGRLVFAYLASAQGRPVPRDELADLLWGDEPPATWEKALSVLVSKLRGVLEECGLDGTAALTSAFGCYRLELSPDSSVDVIEAREAARAAEAALERGELDTAKEAAGLAASLAAPPLLPGEDGAWVEAQRRELADVRERALDCLADGCLAAGEPAVAAKWAEQALEAQPFRESGYRRLMQAHEAAGNRAEALRVYERCRRFLADELGAYPSPETEAIYRRLLAETPSEPVYVEEPAEETVTPPLQGGIASRRARILLAGGVLLVVAAAAAAAIVVDRRGTEPPVLAPDSVGIIDPKSRRLIAETPIAGGPARLASGDQFVWVGSDEAGTLSQVDPREHTVTRLVSSGGFPSDLAGAKGAVWVVDGKTGLLVKVDTDYGTVVGRLRVAAPNALYNRSREDLDPTAVASGMGSIWLTDGSRNLTRVDPRRVKIIERIDVGSPLNGVVVGAGGVWAISGTAATATRLDRQGEVTARIPIVSQPGFQSPYPLAVAVGAGFLWVLNGNTATVTKIDPDQRTVAATIPVGIDRGPVSLAVGDGAAWVAGSDGSLGRIDASTNALDVIPVGRRLKDVEVVDGAVWVTAGVGRSPTAARSTSPRATRVRALPASSCSPMYFEGGGQPQFLIASDLPLQGPGRTLTGQVANAIEFVLRREKFRAGRYAVGYQSCDDSTTQLPYPSPARCAANARAYARNTSVIGVIGSFTSRCSMVLLPIVNRTRAGPLAMISSSNTYVGLTRSAPGTAPGEPGKYFPTGTRSYVRIVAADDLQAAANAILAKQLGVRRVLVVNDDQPYSTGIAAGFRTAARKLGIVVVGTVAFDFEEPLGVVNRSERMRADAVFLAVGGGDEPVVGSLIKHLRAAHRPGFRIIAPDSFADFGALVRTAGTAAEGVTVSLPGLPNERLPTAGREFVAAFGREVGESPSPLAVYAAQAAEVLLDAIARSDGTRASVVARLFETKVTKGLLGSFSIDSNGDTTASAVTIYRIVHGAPSIFRVITPPRSLTR
jgi:branched-chain amino acid transport system substrate-binding protein